MAYDYLKKFNKEFYKDVDVVPWPSNLFYQISKEEIHESEVQLGYQFPPELRHFYETLGAGCLVVPEKIPQNYEFYSTNEILPPLVVARFAKAIVDHRKTPIEEPIECEDHWINDSALDLLTSGDLPFFEIADSSSFMVMKPQSDNPNAVWYMGYEKVEDSFELFIYNLYHKDPAYYTEGWPEEELT